MKCRFSVFLLLCIVFSLAAEIVKKQDDHLVYRQPDGKEVLVKKNPKRVVIAYASLASIALLGFGLQMGCMGLLGLYMGKIFREVQNRPLYIVQEIFEQQHGDTQ